MALNKTKLLGFSVGNFRVFSNEEYFDFAPITILTGKNNSGKSSLIKAIRLFSNSIKLNNGLHLDFTSPDLKLGNFDEVKNHHNNNKDVIDFGVKIEVDNNDSNKSVYTFLLSYNKKELTSFYVEINGEPYLEAEEEFDKRVNEFLNNNDFVNESLFTNFLNMDVFESVRLEQSVIFKAENNQRLTELFKAYQKLPVIDYSDIPKSLKNDSEMRRFFINGWLQMFGIIDRNTELQIESVSGYGYRVMGKQNGRLLHLTEMGYGFAQIIPIILKIWMSENKLIVIEEPESNLHPALQSKLADLFCEAAKYLGIQFIIETHSEYLIRKLQYLTAKTDSELNPEDSLIYYFYSPNEIPDGEQQIKKINITSDGSLTRDFGAGFFDEADRIAIDLYNMTKSRHN